MARDRKSEEARYRRAAEAALRQLDFCVDYFNQIQKRRLATQLARNRDDIRRRLMGNRTRRR